MQIKPDTKIMGNFLTLRIRPKRIEIIDGKEHRDSIFDVLDASGNSVEQFFLMCVTLEEVVYQAQTCEALLADIAQVERGEIKKAGTGLNARALEFTKDGAVFWFEFGPDGEETGGNVSLAQLKLAVETYARFLTDPERKPIEVEFPSI